MGQVNLGGKFGKMKKYDCQHRLCVRRSDEQTWSFVLLFKFSAY
jgi:hypothetical protein